MGTGRPVTQRNPAAILALAGCLAAASPAAIAQSSEPSVLADMDLNIYGWVHMDMIYDFQRSDPDWDDTLRPSRLATRGQPFGEDGETIFSVRQTRVGIRTDVPTDAGPLRILFETDLFGSGSDQGETKFRLRHAYGELGPFGAGQFWTVFMDENASPQTMDFWGPNGQIFYRNIQLRYTIPLGERGSRLAFAVERPGTSIDPGEFRELSPELAEAAQSRDQFPDFTGQWRVFNDYGHFQVAGIVRRIGFETRDTPGNKPDDDLWGAGINLTTSIRASKFLPVDERDRLKLQFVYGEGIGFYMNDGGVDLAPDGSEDDPNADQVPIYGLQAYYERFWSNRWRTSFGYSRVELDGRSLQQNDEFEIGDYATANLVWTPMDAVFVGVEVGWAKREDIDGVDTDSTRIQLSLRYNYSLL